MKIAVIGTGIAGNVAAYHLCRTHDITVFEANDYAGGHTHTHDLELAGRRCAVDTGFIVFNDRTYPNFAALLNELGVASQPTEMSFSVKSSETGLEYNGSNLNTLFAQRRNLLRPSFYRMVRDVLRFNKEARRILDQCDEFLSLGTYLHENAYSRAFIEHYLIPMGAAIWSADPEQVHQFPAHYFVRFFENHGLLSINQRPQWRVIRGGSKAYVEKLTAPFVERIRLNARVLAVKRHATHVEVTTANGTPERFDYVVIASHSNQALAMLSDASALEHEVLGAIPYQDNTAVLHTDGSVLPKRRLAWAAWNYHILPQTNGRVAVTYNMNTLQALDVPEPVCVTLNNSASIDPNKIIKRMRYQHPVFTPKGVKAQQRQHEINGVNRTYFCGAYWRYGFHEDGVVSALAALRHFEERSKHEQLYLRRAS